MKKEGTKRREEVFIVWSYYQIVGRVEGSPRRIKKECP